MQMLICLDDAAADISCSVQVVLHPDAAGARHAAISDMLEHSNTLTTDHVQQLLLQAVRSPRCS